MDRVEDWKRHSDYWLNVPLSRHFLTYEALRDDTQTQLSSLVSYLLPPEDLPSLQQISCAVELHEQGRPYHTARIQHFSSLKYYDDDLKNEIFASVAPFWCRFGYDLLYKQVTGEEPIQCKQTPWLTKPPTQLNEGWRGIDSA